MAMDKVHAVMGSLCSELEARLPGMVEAVYLYGSAALGAYIEGSSDIDFIAVVNRPPSAGDIAEIGKAHEALEHTAPGVDIMGTYMRRVQLGQPFDPASPCPTYFNKQLHTDGTGADVNPVTWFILKHHGIQVYGQPHPLALDVPADALAAYVIANMNDYWAGWIDRLSEQSRRFEAESSGLPVPETLREQLDKAVEWSVLGMLRQWFTIRENGVTSKVGAGLYGLERLPEFWHPLIREAIAVKGLLPERHYESQPERLRDLVQLLEWIRSDSNRLYGESQSI